MSKEKRNAPERKPRSQFKPPPGVEAPPGPLAPFRVKNVSAGGRHVWAGKCMAPGEICEVPEEHREAMMLRDLPRLRRASDTPDIVITEEPVKSAAESAAELERIEAARGAPKQFGGRRR